MAFLQDNQLSPDKILQHIAQLAKQGETETPENPWVTQAVQDATISLTEDIDEGTLIASIDSTPFATLGNFSCIKGKAKTKKTFLITLIVAGFLTRDISLIQGYKPTGKKRIVWFDTEQGRKHVQKAYRRAVKVSGNGSKYELTVFSLRKFNTEERKKIIHQVLVTDNPDNDIALAFLDGIRDLVTDINDPVQSTHVIDWLMMVTESKNLHITTVLHENKNDSNARGHLGTEVVNKSESVVTVEKEPGDISVVKPYVSRDKEFREFRFTITDPEGIPVILDYESDQYDRPKKTFKDITDQDLSDLMDRVFSYADQYSYSDLQRQVSLQAEEMGFVLGYDTVKKAITKCSNLRLIQKSKDGTTSIYRLKNDSV